MGRPRACVPSHKKLGAEVHEVGGGVGGNMGCLGFYVWRPLSVSLLRDLL